MKILAIDSSGMPATVAVLEDGLLTAEYTVHYQRTHSQTLLPMLEEVMTMLESGRTGLSTDETLDALVRSDFDLNTLDRWEKTRKDN